MYARLIDYVIEQLKTDSSFEKLVYKYVLQQDMISGNQLCALLYEQGVLPADDATHDALLSGGISAYSFVLDKIKNLEITPGQLGLDPCSGSAVVIDPKTGETLACVSYPGYDNNKLANSVDSSYYVFDNPVVRATLQSCTAAKNSSGFYLQNCQCYSRSCRKCNYNIYPDIRFG